MIDFEKVCRTCAKEEKELLLLFKNKEVPTFLMEITSISMTENDGFPSHICNRCVNQMHAAISFKNQCIEANNTFLTYLQTNKVFIKSEQPFDENVRNTNEHSLHYSENCIKSEIFANNLKPVVSKKESNDSRDVCNETIQIERVYTLQKTKDNEERNEGKRRREHGSEICKKNVTTSIEKLFQCHICGVRLSHKHNINRHLRIHSEVKSYICEFCGKQFIRHAALALHMKSHENAQKIKRNKINNENRERPFKCETCDKRFVRKSGLQWHQIKHGEKKFVCGQCEKAFSHKSNLELHLRVHTGERPFECEQCKKGFKQEVALIKHRRIHTGEKPFVCETCNKGFTQGPHLKRHMLVHNGEKPFQCALCDRRFTDKQNLKVHTRIHTGEKPYVCSVCNQGFYDSNILKKHKIKKKHC